MCVFVCLYSSWVDIIWNVAECFARTLCYIDGRVVLLCRSIAVTLLCRQQLFAAIFSIVCVCVCSCVVSWSQFHNFVMFLCSVRYRRASWKPGRFILAYYCAKLLSCFIEYSALIRVVTRNAMHYNFNKNLHDSSIYLHAFVCRSLIHSWLLSSREHISKIAELTSRIKWVLSHSNCRKMRAFSNGYNSD